MLDCDGWEYATAYHGAFDATVLGCPVAAIPTQGVTVVTFQPAGWPEAVVREALAVDRRRRERFAAVLTATAHRAAGVAA